MWRPRAGPGFQLPVSALGNFPLRRGFTLGTIASACKRSAECWPRSPPSRSQAVGGEPRLAGEARRDVQAALVGLGDDRSDRPDVGLVAADRSGRALVVGEAGLEIVHRDAAAPCGEQ